MTQAEGVRREYLASVCQALAEYVRSGGEMHIKTLFDPGGEDGRAMIESLQGKSAVVFTIEDWERFRNLLEPGALASSGSPQGD